MGESAPPRNIVVLMPVFSDWPQAARLLGELDETFTASGHACDVVMVDDCSPTRCEIETPESGFQSIQSVAILPLHRNLGHQRAIALGLVHIEREMPCHAVVVMDADGQDRPSDAVRLLAKLDELNGSAVVFAQRTRRAENWSFVIFYWIYQVLSWVSSGKTARVGNFSAVPYGLLRGLVTVSEMWNHYAAAVHVARIPLDTVPTSRSERYAGRSTMNFQGWIAHGIGAISVYGPIVGARLLVLQSLILVGVLGVMAVFAREIVSSNLLLVLLALGLFAQGGLTLFALVVIITGSRDRLAFLPVRDYVHFVGETYTVYPRD